MPDNVITPQEYELHLKDLTERLRAHLGGGGEDARTLLREAEELLELGEVYPEVLQRHTAVEGLVAGVLAHERQREFTGDLYSDREAPGCLLGWLFGGK